MDVSSPFPVLHQAIISGGAIDVGRIDVLDCAAVASDARTLWVALTRRQGETLVDLLTRLNDTLEQCLSNGACVDELHREHH